MSSAVEHASHGKALKKYSHYYYIIVIIIITSMVGIKKKNGHVHKISLKMVNSRDLAGNAEEEKDGGQFVVVVMRSVKKSWL